MSDKDKNITGPDLLDLNSSLGSDSEEDYNFLSFGESFPSFEQIEFRAPSRNMPELLQLNQQLTDRILLEKDVVLNAKYKIIKVLGQGGMGTVYQALDTDLNRKVALKFVKQDQHFAHEGIAQARLIHKNIATLFGQEKHDPPFLVMEYIKGKDCRLFTKNYIAIVDLAIQICQALKFAHSMGIVHRDIKPENIKVKHNGQVKVLDFGLAMLTAPPSGSQADSGDTFDHKNWASARIGTEAYFSPEQCLGKLQDERTDIWAVGVVLYEMLTEELPFSTTNELIDSKHLPSLKSIPKQLHNLFRRSLAKNSADRFQNADDMLFALQKTRKTLIEQGFQFVTIGRSLSDLVRWQVTALLVLHTDTKLSHDQYNPDNTENPDSLDTPSIEAIIERHGGVIEQKNSDRILALWGIEGPREQDPERGVRAALEIRDHLKFVYRRLSQLPVRLCLNTGKAVLKPRGVEGEAISEIEVLEELLPEGHVVVTQKTFHHIRGIFALEPLVYDNTDPQLCSVKKLELRTLMRQTRGIEGVTTQTIGRDLELRKLTNLLDTVIEDKDRLLVTLVGDAGIGKSRILSEFEAQIRGELQLDCFQGRADEGMKHQPYALIRDLFCFYCVILESDPPEITRTKIEKTLESSFGADPASHMKTHVIGQMLGFDFNNSPHLKSYQNDAKQLHERGIDFLKTLFGNLSRGPDILFDNTLILLNNKMDICGCSKTQFPLINSRIGNVHLKTVSGSRIKNNSGHLIAGRHSLGR